MNNICTNLIKTDLASLNKLITKTVNKYWKNSYKYVLLNYLFLIKNFRVMDQWYLKCLRCKMVSKCNSLLVFKRGSFNFSPRKIPKFFKILHFSSFITMSCFASYGEKTVYFLYLNLLAVSATSHRDRLGKGLDRNEWDSFFTGFLKPLASSLSSRNSVSFAEMTSAR